MSARPRSRYTAWAIVGTKSGRVLTNGRGNYGIYTHRVDAENDCPTYGDVRRVAITVPKFARARKKWGII